MNDPRDSEIEVNAGREAVVPAVAQDPGAARQRPLAAIVVVSAILVVVGITAGPWGRTTFSGQDNLELEVDLDASGSVHVRTDVDDTDPDLAASYDSADNEVQRMALEESVPGTSSELARILAVLVAVVGAVALMRDLTTHSWVLVTALAVGCLVLVVVVRDDVIAALATHSTAMELADHETSPTFWGALAVGSSAAAALAAGFAAAPRPAGTRARRAAPPGPDGSGTEARPARRRLVGWKARAPHNTF